MVGGYGGGKVVVEDFGVLGYMGDAGYMGYMKNYG